LEKRVHEDEPRGTISKWPLFNKINDIISSFSKVTGISNAIDSGEKLKTKRSQEKEKGPLNLNDELPSPSPSDSSHDTSKYDDSIVEREDDLGSKWLGK
jgi:hypothetical protein